MRPAPHAVPYRAGRFPVRVPTAGDRDRERARTVRDPALALPADGTLGRPLGFAFGAGDRGAGLYGAGTHKRLAGVETYDPANLFRMNYGVSACRPASRRWAARPSPGRP